MGLIGENEIVSGYVLSAIRARIATGILLALAQPALSLRISQRFNVLLDDLFRISVNVRQREIQNLECRINVLGRLRGLFRDWFCLYCCNVAGRSDSPLEIVDLLVYVW